MLKCWDVHPHPGPSTVKYTLDMHAVLYMQQMNKNNKSMHCEICKYANRSHTYYIIMQIGFPGHQQ